VCVLAVTDVCRNMDCSPLLVNFDVPAALVAVDGTTLPQCVGVLYVNSKVASARSVHGRL
jgi:hypothetical protein